jgi:hypothetical protein
MYQSLKGTTEEMHENELEDSTFFTISDFRLNLAILPEAIEICSVILERI